MAAILSPLQASGFRSRPRLPRVPREDLLHDPKTLKEYLYSLDRCLHDFYQDLEVRARGYLIVPMGKVEFDAAAVAGAVVLAQPEKDTDYQPILTPDWNAHLWVTALTTGGFTINANAAPGGGGGVVRWTIAR